MVTVWYDVKLDGLDTLSVRFGLRGELLSSTGLGAIEYVRICFMIEHHPWSSVKMERDGAIAMYDKLWHCM